MDDNLHWHALNYRNAAPQHASAAWVELEACVARIERRALEKQAAQMLSLVDKAEKYRDMVAAKKVSDGRAV